MSQPETCINQTLLMWSAVVIVEIFIIAYLMNSPSLALLSIIMAWPGKAAMNWPIEDSEDDSTEDSKTDNEATALNKGQD
ncbi:MAG: hypothetical protein Kow0029_03710 [Candidatus Rifleibacteriota bacterium]